MKKVDIIGINSPKTKQIIIARFNENLSWLRWIKNIPYVVYDKSNKTSPHHLPNIPTFPIHCFEGVKHAKSPTGRESHTYLYHIIKHYDQLADINIFMQGNPVEMSSDARYAMSELFQRDFEGVNFLPLNFPLMICTKRSAPLHYGLPMERIFKRLFQNPCPDIFLYSWGSMFTVSKEYIHKRPISFYEEMMQIIYDEPLSGYIYERLWPTVLACHNYIPHEFFSKKDRSKWQLPGLPYV